MRDIGGHILTNLPVAPRRRADQLALFVAQRAGEAVDLVLGGEGDRRIGIQIEEAPHPRDPLAHLFAVEGVVEAHHPHRVRHLGQRRCGDLVAHALRGRIGPHQIGKGRLKRLVPAHQRVIFLVGNLRRVFRMIQAVVFADGPREPHQLVGGLGFGEGLGKVLGVVHRALR